MTRTWMATIALAAVSVTAFGQQPQPLMSPEGSAQVQVLGKWVEGDRPAFTLGREQYQGGKWIEITYGRPLQRGRDLVRVRRELRQSGQ